MTHRYIVTEYKLFTITNGIEEFEEETSPQRPFWFMTGLDMVIDSLEQRLSTKKPGDSYDFTLAPSEAFGERIEDKRVTVHKDRFMVDGKFDEENIFVGNTIQLNDFSGNPFNANVVEITDESVSLDVDADLNHPLAGKSLHFVGTIIENREASEHEVKKVKKMLSGEGCGGHCHGGCNHGECGGDCDHEGCGGDCDHEGCGGDCHCKE